MRAFLVPITVFLLIATSFPARAQDAAFGGLANVFDVFGKPWPAAPTANVPLPPRHYRSTAHVHRHRGHHKHRVRVCRWVWR